jgi:hypothetical protein
VGYAHFLVYKKTGIEERREKSGEIEMRIKGD